MEKRRKRQHTVSKFYIRGFANEQLQTMRVELPGDRSHAMTINDASVIKDFYTIDLPDGSKSDYFERAFGEIEGLAAEALRKLLAGEWPTGAETRSDLSRWIALQHLRTEEVRAGQGHMQAQVIRLLVGASGKEALRKHIQEAESRAVPDAELDAEWLDLTKPGGPTLKPDVKEHVRAILSILDGMTNFLNDSQWMLYRFRRKALVTSDHPVTLLVGEDHPEWEGVGIATADAFLVPLHRRAALIIQPRSRLDDYEQVVGRFPDVRLDGSTKLSLSMNQETAARARRHIYHHPDDSPLERLYIPDPIDGTHAAVSDMSGLIREEGLFQGMTDEQRSSWANMPKGEGEGMSLGDLPWPIPGRVRPTRWTDVPAPD
jgi:hypothetical protein